MCIIEQKLNEKDKELNLNDCEVLILSLSLLFLNRILFFSIIISFSFSFGCLLGIEKNLQFISPLNFVIVNKIFFLFFWLIFILYFRGQKHSIWKDRRPKTRDRTQPLNRMFLCLQQLPSLFTCRSSNLTMRLLRLEWIRSISLLLGSENFVGKKWTNIRVPRWQFSNTSTIENESKFLKKILLNRFELAFLLSQTGSLSRIQISLHNQQTTNPIEI